MKTEISITTKHIILFLFACVITLSCSERRNAVMTSEQGTESQANNAVGVKIKTLERTGFKMELISNGKLRAASKSALYFTSGGSLTAVNCRNGDFVNKGQILAEIDNREFKIALKDAETSLEKAKLDYRDVLAGQGYSLGEKTEIPAEIEKMARVRSGLSLAENKLEKARLDYEGTILHSPISGRVAGLKLKRYEKYSTSEAFCQIIDDRNFDVEFNIIESKYSFLEKGMKVKVHSFSDKDFQLEGQLSEISPEVDKNGQIAVKARLYGGKGFIDGMNVKVSLEKTMAASLTVPKSAVLRKGDYNVLFTYGDDSLAHWVYVDILYENSCQYAVAASAEKKATLEEGAIIITSGNLTLADRTPVRIEE